ncbi:tRNA(Ile)-lysidine synthase [Thalassobacillus devorans]|uniref:tRNA(Ile)-lysidine synthase n=1 Tax=Thalassobacillus devorans TaxID=279813 RepID=A0ABQ1PV39_9BACI|nr:tRNA lysidine(34) synthetase TilS [Thalassobacillus devorans]NIK30815.1 tRNA(Ile)-lysidine synthase [Thalassobacillus devorans]GGD04453.1 tRNA(Ile)-lysidine synthase [Thalassobacillus devorans]
MKTAVDAFIERNRLLEQGQTVLIAVSGGPDSMALLHYFKTIREPWGLSLIAASVDHGLRGAASIEDLTYVKEVCKQWNIDFVGTSVDVPTYKKQYNLNTQEAARILRYQFFQEQMNKKRAGILALGHHGDDQAETMLMRLVRGTTPGGLTGIPVKRDFAGGKIIRPFLGVTKEEILAYCKEYHIHPREDLSNKDTKYTRNYFRHKILPLMKAENPKLNEHLWKLSQDLKEDEEYLQQQAEKLLEKVAVFEKDKKNISFSVSEFNTYPIALQRRAFHLILNYLYDGNSEDFSYIHEQQFFDFLTRDIANGKLDWPGGLWLQRNYGKITFHFNSSYKPASYRSELGIGDTYRLPDGSELSVKLTTCKNKEDKCTLTCDVTHVELPLIVRTRRPGDRMTWKGLNGSRKIKDIFIDQKVPKEARDSWPLITDQNGKILWLVGLKKSTVCSGGTSGEWLEINYSQPKEDR